MKIPQVQRLEMLKAAKPLMDWLEQNTHPHCTIILDSTKAELVEGLACGKKTEVN